MRSPFPSLMKILLLPSILACCCECFSQEKSSSAEEDAKPSSNGPIEIKSKPTSVVPPIIFSNQIVQQSVVNGVRTIVATGNGEKVEITDTNGKDIVLKHTRMVSGKSETTEYKADDLAALKLKSPEAAALFEKYASRQAAPVQARARFQVPMQGRQPAPQQLALIDDSPAGAGPRRIRVELEDRRIEIVDSADESILLKVIKTVDGHEQVEEFTADNLRQFKNLHPEAYRLYKKYTGLKAD